MHHLDPFWATQGPFKLSGAFLSHSEPLLNSRRLFESLKTLSVAFLSHFEQLLTCTRTLILSHSEPIKTFLNFFKQFGIYTRSEILRKKRKFLHICERTKCKKAKRILFVKIAKFSRNDFAFSLQTLYSTHLEPFRIRYSYLEPPGTYLLWLANLFSKKISYFALKFGL